MNNKRYNKELDAALYDIPVYTQCPELDEHQTQTRIDGYMDCLRTYMIDAAKIRNTFDGRYGLPMAAEDKVQTCYKNVKRLFRKL